MRARLAVVVTLQLVVVGTTFAVDDWTQMVPSGVPPSARDTHAVAYLGGDQVLLFGGWNGSSAVSDTWLYDLSTNIWTPLSPTGGPPSAREQHAMAYLGGDQVLLFGGHDAGGYDNETWVYDLSANTWTLMSPSGGPPSARSQHAMAYLGGDQVLLFGGFDGFLGVNDTWVYDLSANSWTQMSPTGGPPSVRDAHAMAYLGDDQALLFGGYDAGGRDNETWVYDLSADTWTLMSPSGGPPSARYYHAAAHIGGDQAVLFGGDDGSLDNETWEYDLSANTWTLMSPSGGPPSARKQHAMTYIGDDQLLLFGGYDGALDVGDTWVYDLSAATWTLRIPTVTHARDTHAMAYLGGDQVLLFGGWVGSSSINDTWVYDLSVDTWTLMSPSGGPPSAREQHAMAYVGGDQVLLFGGYDGFTYVNDTWVYDLSANSWTLMSPSGGPPSGRSFHAMAYLGGDQVLLFGGYDGSTYVNDTWVYDLSANSWTLMSPSGGPPSARDQHAMAGLGGDQALLFGGRKSGGHDNETWVYDLSANSWTQMSPSGGPPSAREAHAMAYLGDDQVLLFGGDDGSFDNETWIYDLSANTWAQDTNTTQPSAREGHAMAESGPSGYRRVVLFGGHDGALSEETWTFGGGDYPLPVELLSFTVE